MAVTEPGEAKGLDLEASELSPLAVATGLIGGQRGHWKDEGLLVLYGGHVAIINGAGEGWEDKLNSLGGVKAVRLDGEHIAVRVTG